VDAGACAFRHVLRGQWSLVLGLAGLELAQAVASEFDSVGVVDDAIEDGFSKRPCVQARDRAPLGVSSRRIFT
jgi:hypothetical protein